MTHRILILDDEPHVLSALKRTLSQRESEDSVNYQVEIFSDAEAALARLYESAFDAVLSDYRMAGMNGVEFLTKVRAIQPDAVRIILSGYADLEALITAINEAEIFRFVSKPWIDYELKILLKQAIETRELLMENQRLADVIRVERGLLSRHEAELRRLEKESPGITRVKWGDRGEVYFEDMSQEELLEVERLLHIPQSG